MSSTVTHGDCSIKRWVDTRWENYGIKRRNTGNGTREVKGRKEGYPFALRHIHIYIGVFLVQLTILAYAFMYVCMFGVRGGGTIICIYLSIYLFTQHAYHEFNIYHIIIHFILYK